MMLWLTGAATLLAVGVLLGLGLHGRIVDQKYRRLAHLVRELNERQDEASGDRLVLTPAHGNGARRVGDLPRQYGPRPGRGRAPRASAGDPARG